MLIQDFNIPIQAPKTGLCEIQFNWKTDPQNVDQQGNYDPSAY
jgi:hypothetical protein